MNSKLSFCIAFVLVVILSSCSDQGLDMDKHDKGFDVNTRAEIQFKTNNIVSNLFSSFQTSVTRSQETIYPDYYGGLYATEDGQVNILIAGEAVQYQEEFIRRSGTNDINLISCKYAYTELISIMNSITRALNEEKKDINDLIKFRGCQLVDDKNLINILLGDCTPAAVEIFKSQVSDFPGFIFSEVPEFTFQASIHPGTTIRSSTSYGSVGYRARYNGENGIVVSGHVMKNIGANLLNENNTLIGVVRQCKTSDTVDAAFCALYSGYDPGNYVGGIMPSLNARLADLYAGKWVNMCGRHNHGDGIISTTYVNLSPGPAGAPIYGLVAAPYPSQSGDSGGIVYDDYSDIAGIHEASGTLNGKATAVFVKASEINKTFV